MDLPTEEETYDFFTRVWEKTEDKDADKESETPVAAAAEDAAEEERQEVQLFACINPRVTICNQWMKLNLLTSVALS